MKKFLFAFFAFACVLFSSCQEVGLGEEIDLEAPVLAVTSLTCGSGSLTEIEGGVTCNTNVDFTGTATDNKKVSRVVAELKWSSDTEFVQIGTATLSGSDWSFHYDFLQEGACYLKFTAEDPGKNYSINTAKTLTLFIDKSAPSASAWYIDRELNGIQYNLKGLETLKALDLDLPENKDAVQNVGFTICGNASDAFGISTISLKIKDESGATIATVQNSNTDNNYAPKFKVTHDILVQGNKTLESGTHYLQAVYEAEDVTEFPGANKTGEVAIGWFIWRPESDVPQIVNSDIAEETSGTSTTLSMNVRIQDMISLTFFDDDELAEGYFALLTAEEASALFASSDWEKIKAAPSLMIDAVKANADNDEATDAAARANRAYHFTATNSEREVVVSLKAAKKPQTMRLVAFGWDNTTAKKQVAKDVSVRVTDESTPILLITTPKNNSVPAFNADGATTTITGQTLDSAGCAYLEFVWVSDSVVDKKKAAMDWLDTITTDAAHTALGNATNRITKKDGMKLWSVPLADNGTSGGFVSQTFSFSVDLLSDFTTDDADSAKNEKAKEKYFLVKLTRKDGKYIYQEYKFADDNLPPQIVSVSPYTDMQIVQKTTDFTIKFKAHKESGLAIDQSSYKIERVMGESVTEITSSVSGYSDVRYNSATGYYEATVSSTLLTELNDNGARPTYRLSASDIFGNDASAQYTLVISDLPALTGVSSTAATMCKKGDVIDIIASFTKPVKVYGSPRLKLKGVTNAKNGTTAADAVYAGYTSGSDTTALHFAYTVQDGDTSDGLTLFSTTPFDDNESATLTSEKVIMTALSEDSSTSAKNTFDAKGIKLDGVTPSVTGISITGDGVTTGGITYLREGKVITAVLTMSENVIVQGSPAITLYAGGSATNTVVLPFTGIEDSGSSTLIRFSKTVSTADANGALSYAQGSYITNAAVITDGYGNSLELTETGTVQANLNVDTVAPKTPGISARYNNAAVTLTNNGKYKTSVSFTLSKAEADSTVQALQYSTDGGSTWTGATEGVSVTLSSSASFTYRAVDYAGNVSAIADPIYLDIENTFPAFSVECVNADGNYKAGSSLTLRVSFVRAVNVAANAGAYVTVSAATGSGGGKAYLANKTARSAQSLDFTYTVQSGDDFTLKVAQNAITLTGITDEYGIAQNGKAATADCTRTGVKCDGKAPTVSSMTDGDGSTGTVFTQGNKIVLTFNENVIKSSGSITIRRTNTNSSGVRDGAWAVPPVLTAAEFNKICSNITSSQKNTLSLQEDGHDMEDSEWVGNSGSTYDNKYYHGTGQFVGPYKKMTQGILDSGEPDVDTKYVLDFDMDIWETTTAHYYGKTFTSSTQTSPTTLTASNATTITVGNIRSVLESAGYHKRVLDVTSNAVVVSGNTVTITFPKGLCDSSASLPEGIEWELLVDGGAFMDESGNTMDAYTSSTFFSTGVQTPVIRVDRYSYGLGIYQGNNSGGKSMIANQGTVPSGYVRVRIDCQTPSSTIKYKMVDATIDDSLTTGIGGRYCTWQYKKTYAKTLSNLNDETLSNTYAGAFGAGNGSYTTACRKYIVAQATKSGLGTSEKGYEGIFQTVVKFNCSNGTHYDVSKLYNVSIRGTTGWSGEPSISPFPLRDAQVGSPFIRRCYYKDSSTYYWISYEILEDASISGYIKGDWTNYYLSSWGYVYVGGYTEMSGLTKD